MVTDASSLHLMLELRTAQRCNGWTVGRLRQPLLSDRVLKPLHRPTGAGDGSPRSLLTAACASVDRRAVGARRPPLSALARADGGSDRVEHGDQCDPAPMLDRPGAVSRITHTRTMAPASRRRSVSAQIGPTR